MTRRTAISFLLTIVVMALLIAGCLGKGNTYEAQQGYSFTFPDPWQVEEGPYQKSFLFQADPDVVLGVKDKSDEITFLLVVGTPVEGPITERSLKEELGETLVGVSVRIPSFEVLSSKVTKSGDVWKQQFTYSTKDDTGKAIRGHFVRLINIKGEKYFLNVNLLSTPSDYRYSNTDFESIVDSIQLPQETEEGE